MDRKQTIIAALVALALAATLAVVISRSSSRDEAELAEEQEEAQSAQELAASDQPEQEPEGAEDEPLAAPSGGAEPAQRRQATAPDASEPLTPEVVEHAQNMAIPTTIMAMERGDVKHLHVFLQFIAEHKEDQIVSEADLGAVEAAIACLEHAPDAREEAADFLRFGGATALADSLRKVCNRR